MGQLRVVPLDARTRPAKRLQELIEAICGGATLTPQEAVAAHRAAELILVAEMHRARAVHDPDCDINQLTRLERLAERALKGALAMLRSRRDETPSLTEYLRRKSA
jgi:uncharacterized iron-regulated protein